MENAWLRGRKTGLEDIVIDLTVAGFGAFIFFFAQPRQAVSSANRASSTAESLASNISNPNGSLPFKRRYSAITYGLCLRMHCKRGLCKAT